jgi:hypothetical protein
MTVGWCVGYCVGLNLIYAGLGNGTICCEYTPTSSPDGRTSVRALFVVLTFRIADCGNDLAEIAQNATETDCNTPCAGDSTEMCGAINPPRINLYYNTVAPAPPAPSISQTDNTGSWDYIGCYKYAYCPFVQKRFHDGSERFPNSDTDEGPPTALGVSVTTSLPGGGDNTTVENCTNECGADGYPISGMMWGNQCCTRSNLFSSTRFSLLKNLRSARLRLSNQLSVNGWGRQGL